jgi:ferredoxin-NADP reductase
LLPGQYAEWTIHTKHDDSRGNRRYFTIASSPAEGDLHIGVKIYDKPSTYKQSLTHLKVGDTILVGSIAGDFTMPKDTTQKLAFIAGGIGITPFRSQVQHMIDARENRDAVLLYSNRSEEEIAYFDFFNTAAEKLGGLFRVVHTLTGLDAPHSWKGEQGFIDENFIQRNVPDYYLRKFYISGPQGMVSASVATLLKLGVLRTNIHTDYFPGFA